MAKVSAPPRLPSVLEALVTSFFRTEWEERYRWYLRPVRLSRLVTTTRYHELTKDSWMN